MPNLGALPSYLDSILALVLVYFLLSGLVSILTERYAKLFRLRPNFLQSAVFKLCQDSHVSYGHLVYTHPLVKAISKNEKQGPSYLAADTFADAFIDVIGKAHPKYLLDPGSASANPYRQFREGIAEMGSGDLKIVLTQFVQAIEASEPKTELWYGLLRTKIMGWYTTYGERVTGQYKIRMGAPTFWFALAVTLFLNVDSIHLFQVFTRNEPLRAAMVAKAEKIVAAQNNTATDSLALAYLKELQQEPHLMGWDSKQAPLSWLPKRHRHKKKHRHLIIVPGAPAAVAHAQADSRNQWSVGNLMVYLFGLSISALSLSFGAPFWFEVLNKFINIRRAGKPA